MADREVEPGSVRFATLVDDEHGLHMNFMNSWNPLLAYDLGQQGRIWAGGTTFQPCSSVGVVEGRNSVVESFLESSAEWLFFIDADMGFDHDCLEKLIAVADPKARPIVGGLCFGFGPVVDVLQTGFGVQKVPFPTIFDLRTKGDEDVAFSARWGYVPNEVQECDATGGAMLLIHGSVLEAIAAERERVGAWFDRIKHPKAKKMWGEDTSFCMRAKMLGFPTFVHAGVRTSHAKTIHVTQATYMSQLVAQPATEATAVIVPVLNRPQNAAPFMRSVRASTGLVKVYAACSETADADAWKAAGATVVECEGTTFAEKVNEAYEWTEEPWVFLVGDDVIFRPGWLDHAQQMAKNTGAKVVGTNDLGNPRVMHGEHATHLLIGRDYIDQVGATFPKPLPVEVHPYGPGVVCYEGYQHWYVDDEIVTAAKQRNLFAPALAAVVEHLHPIWGKAEQDETYKLGQSSADRDKITYSKRLKANAA